MAIDLFSSDILKRSLAMYSEDISRGADMVFEMLAELHVIENLLAIKESFIDSRFALDSVQNQQLLAVVVFLIFFIATYSVFKFVRCFTKPQRRVSSFKTDW